MNFLLILWHEWLMDNDDAELFERTCDGTASDIWAARVRQMIIWRQGRIDELSERSWLMQFIRRHWPEKA